MKNKKKCLSTKQISVKDNGNVTTKGSNRNVSVLGFIAFYEKMYVYQFIFKTIFKTAYKIPKLGKEILKNHFVLRKIKNNKNDFLQ